MRTYFALIPLEYIAKYANDQLKASETVNYSDLEALFAISLLFNPHRQPLKANEDIPIMDLYLVSAMNWSHSFRNINYRKTKLYIAADAIGKLDSAQGTKRLTMTTEFGALQNQWKSIHQEFRVMTLDQIAADFSTKFVDPVETYLMELEKLADNETKRDVVENMRAIFRRLEPSLPGIAVRLALTGTVSLRGNAAP